MIRTAAALLAAVIALAACGDEGGDKGAYVRKGNAICANYGKEIAKLGTPDTLTKIGPYITNAMPLLTRTVAAIEKLDAPSDLRDAFDTFRDAARATVDRAERLRRAAEAGDAEEVQTLLKEASAASKRRVGLARDAGLETCAKL